MEGEGKAPHVAIMPGIGMGHLIPHLELAKQLVLRHGFQVTIIATAAGNSFSKTELSFLNSLPSGIDYIALPPVQLPADLFILNRFFLTIIGSLPALRDALHQLKRTTRFVAFVADCYCADAFDVTRELGVPAFIFFTSSLFLLSLSLHLPGIHESAPDLPDEVKLPGCISLLRQDFPDAIKEPKGDFFPLFLNNVRRYSEAKGILVNTFQELEPGSAAYFKRKDTGWPAVYLIGPVMSDTEPQEKKKAQCMEWLDKQPSGSVLYISFGSMAMLTHAQMKEMALGLEDSGQRFLWVVRFPADKLAVQEVSSDDPMDYLPEGFMERTSGLGFVETGWAPQVEILSHPSTEGFLTHCGWNSTHESIVNGVAMIAWPVYAEQKMNAAFLVEDVRMALRPEKAENGVVRREEVSRVAKELMEGKRGREVRENVRKLQKAAEKATSEGGSSYQDLAALADEWKNAIFG